MKLYHVSSDMNVGLLPDQEGFQIHFRQGNAVRAAAELETGSLSQ